MNYDKTTQLQDYLDHNLADCPSDWNTPKDIFQSATVLISEKSRNFSYDWFDDDDDVQIHNPTNEK